MTISSDLPYIIKNYKSQDLNSFVHFNLEIHSRNKPECTVSTQSLLEHLNRPHFIAEMDMFVATTGDQIVGYLEITPEIIIGRAIVDCLIHPQHRQKGLATQLFQLALQRSRQLGAKVIHANALEENLPAAKLSTHLGFIPVRRYLEMHLNLSDYTSSSSDYPRISISHFQNNEEEMLARIQNRAFSKSWGYSPNSIEDIKYYLSTEGFNPNDVIFGIIDTELVGYCWTQTECVNHVSGNTSAGRIHMMGVDPSYQQKGFGKELLIAGINHIISRKLKGVELTVDGQNTTALALYKSAGFKEKATTIWYEKKLN